MKTRRAGGKRPTARIVRVISLMETPYGGRVTAGHRPPPPSPTRHNLGVQTRRTPLPCSFYTFLLPLLLLFFYHRRTSVQRQTYGGRDASFGASTRKGFGRVRWSRLDTFTRVLFGTRECRTDGFFFIRPYYDFDRCIRKPIANGRW